jgi:hypothetical protein
VDWENSFNADAIRNFADCECLTDARTSARDNETLEDLDTALITFNDADVNFEFIAGAEIR